MPISSLCVFSGSSSGHHPAYAAAATELGELLARERIRLVYGGGGVGLMGRAADAAMAAGAEVIGVIPTGMFERDVANHHITELRVVDSMHERKRAMYELADAFVILPGGLGTLDELAEVTTWAQLGLHAKPLVLLDINGYFSAFLAFLDHALGEGFISQASRDLLVRVDTVDEILAACERYQAPARKVWIEAAET